MNLSDVIPPTQMILAWTLLGVLCAWMIVCAFLALRPQKGGKREAADLPTPSGVMPAVASPMPLRRVAAPVDRSFSSVSLGSSESVSDIGSPVG